MMETLTNIPLGNILVASCIFILGYILARFIGNKAVALAQGHFSAHQSLIVKRFLHAAILLLFIMSGLQHLGFNFSVLLGAAGVFSVALSFASQTSVSNLISGLFLLFEKPFQVGDTIEIKNLVGKVHSIDLLSTKIISPDNKLIRLPNEALIKSDIVNLSYFDTRRLDFSIDIAYEADVDKAINCLMSLAKQEDKILPTSAPTVVVNRLKESSVELKMSVWVNLSELNTVKTRLHKDILSAFKQQAIEIPYPQMVLHKGN